jgi:hypothetical protein
MHKTKFKELVFDKCIAVLYIMVKNSNNRQYGTMKVTMAASFT